MSKKEKKSCNYCSVGGQALLEGIMMKSPENIAVAVRRPDKKIQVRVDPYVPMTKRKKWYGYPVVRGLVSFAEAMQAGMKTMSYATIALGEEEEEPTKFEKWMSEKLGKNVEDIIMGIGMVLGVALAVGLFFLLPSFLGSLFGRLFGVTGAFWINLIEGLVRIGILIGYMAAISLIKDIKRMFSYHGAEHKTIATYEAGEPLTVENVKKHSRLHPRCGTNYLFLVMFISILFYALVGFTGHWLVKTLIKLALIPVIAGVSYEVLKAAAKTDCLLARIIRWPGMQMQHITTKEPADDVIEVAIVAFQLAMDPHYYDEGDERLIWFDEAEAQKEAAAAPPKTRWEEAEEPWEEEPPEDEAGPGQGGEEQGGKSGGAAAAAIAPGALR